MEVEQHLGALISTQDDDRNADDIHYLLLATDNAQEACCTKK